MTVLGESITPSRIVESTRELIPTVAARAGEVEAARRVPRDLLDQLVGAGCFRMLTPTTHGGAGAELSAALRLFETLARADASVAWIVMIGGCSWLDLAGLPRATFDALLGRPGAIGAGVFGPAGSIARQDGGFRLSGRWSFASGCEHADWIYLNSVEGVVDGAPALRMAVLDPGQVEIEDTWTVAGLCGTGSHHVRVTDALVPAGRTLRPMVDEPCLDELLVRIPTPAVFALTVAAVAVGIALGALDDVVALAEGKVPLLAGATLASSSVFQLELATADTELRAARGLLQDTAESLWASAAAGSMITLQARARAAAAWATTRAAAAAGTAYRNGGGGALYADSPLQRRLRDVHAVTQHFLVRRDTLATAGAVLAGQEITVPVF